MRVKHQKKMDPFNGISLRFIHCKMQILVGNGYTRVKTPLRDSSLTNNRLVKTQYT